MYCMQPSRVQISDVRYKNIRGSSISNVAVSIACSSLVPCQGIEMADIDFNYDGNNVKDKSISAKCENAKIKYEGTQNPKPCEN